MRFVPFLLVLCSATQFTHNRFTEDGKTFSQDGVNLTTACMSKVQDDAVAAMLCAGYVEGIADLLSEDAICVPPEVAGKQLVEAVVQYAEKHQEILHHPASRIVAEALKAKYHCTR
jgi:hypothetical protein